MPFFFGEEIPAVRNDQPQITGIGLVQAGIINFVDDTVREGKPDLALSVGACAYTALGTGCPTRLTTRRARGGCMIFNVHN